MAKYEEGDIVTYYFIIVEDGNDKRIQAWSDHKELVKYYMEFHKCKYYSIKKVDDIFERVMDIINENANDETLHLMENKERAEIVRQLSSYASSPPVP